MQTVGMFMSLRTQGLGQSRHRCQLTGELLDVRAIAQGRDRSAFIAPAARLPGLFLTDDEDTVLGEVDFVDGDPTGRQKVADRFWQGHLGEGDRRRFLHLGQAEQGRGLVVVEDEPTGIVGEDEALAQGMQGRIVEREQTAQFLRTIAEGDSAQVAGEQPGAESAEGERGEADEDDLRQEAACATDRVSSVTPTATIAVTSPSASLIGTIARTDGPSVPTYSSVWVCPARAFAVLPR